MKRKILSLMLALVLALSLCLVTAVPAGAQGEPSVMLGTTDIGKAEWTTETAAVGNYSAKLYWPVGSRAFVIINIPEEMTISDIASWSYYAKAPKYYMPQVTFYVDHLNINNPEGKDYDTTITSSFGGLGNETWIEVDETTIPNNYGSYVLWINSDDAPVYGNSWTDLQEGFELWGREHEYGDSVVKHVKVGKGVIGTNKDITAYVDDFIMNGVTYEFEPPPATTVYVDATWASQTDVDDFDLIWQYDAFAVIQDGINAVAEDGSINVAAGTYNECLAVNKSVSIVGTGISEVTINTSGLEVNNAGIYVSVDDVSLQGFTQVGDPAASTPNYGIKFGAVSGGSVTDILVRDIYRSGFDFLGTMNTTVSNIESRDNGGHGIQLCDCTDVALSDITVSGNGWEGVSVATLGKFTPLGTSGIVFSGTNSFGDVFQLEEGDFNNLGIAPAGEAIITYSTNVADGADVTVQASDFGYALHGDQDDGPGQNRVWFFETLAEAQAVALEAPVGHFNGSGIYIESLTDRTQLYRYLPDGWSIISPDRKWSDWQTLGAELTYAYDAANKGFGDPEYGLPLSPLTALYVKTDGGGLMRFSYQENDLGMYATNLEAGWNLIGIPETGAAPEAILSPIRLGANNEVALATLASQGNYNPSGETFYRSMLVIPGPVPAQLSPFDGYWAYMNVAKEFGVVVVPEDGGTS